LGPRYTIRKPLASRQSSELRAREASGLAKRTLSKERRAASTIVKTGALGRFDEDRAIWFQDLAGKIQPQLCLVNRSWLIARAFMRDMLGRYRAKHRIDATRRARAAVLGVGFLGEGV
jgi:hypothetical protein